MVGQTDRVINLLVPKMMPKAVLFKYFNKLRQIGKSVLGRRYLSRIFTPVQKEKACFIASIRKYGNNSTKALAWLCQLSADCDQPKNGSG